MNSESTNSDANTITSIKSALATPSDDKIRKEVVSPTSSYIVQAPAGSGKTTLLVERYVELLSIVNNPEEILAITFTRKAASEMRARVMKKLTDSRWPDEPEMLDRATRAALERNARQGWEIQLNPQRLKIQTIDSFAYSLVKRLPYESELSLEYETIDDSIQICEDAARTTIEHALSDSEYASFIAEFVSHHGNDPQKATTMLAEMLKKREHWIDIVSSVQATLLEEDGAARAQQILGDNRKEFVGKLVETALQHFPDDLIEDIKTLAQYSSVALNEEFDDLTTTDDLAFVARMFCTQKNKFRKAVNKTNGFPVIPGGGKGIEDPNKLLWLETLGALRQAIPEERMGRYQGVPSLSTPDSHIKALECHVATLIVAVQELNEIFRQRRVVDFTEVATAAMRALQSEGMPSELALALDYRIAHILVDEFQDTSQSQFRLLKQLMLEWEADSPNTFFAVGDPMQSIYRFRNAELSLYQRIYRDGISDLPQLNVKPRRLEVNFRSSPQVIDTVNAVFSGVFGNVDDPDLGSVAFAESKSHLQTDGEFSFTFCDFDETGDAEAAQVAELINKIRDSVDGDDTIGLLVQQRTHLAKYLNALRDREITWSGVNIESMSAVPVVRDLNNLVKCVRDDKDKLAWLAFFRSPLCGLDLDDLEILNGCESGAEMRRRPDLSELGNQLVARIKPAFDEFFADEFRTFRSKLERLWYGLGGNDAYQKRAEGSHNVVALTNAERFFDWVDEATSGKLDFNLLQSKVDNEWASQSDDKADVEVITIHKAKGLEYDHVVIADTGATPRPQDKEMVIWRLEGRQPVIALNLDGEDDLLFDWIRTEELERVLNERKRLLYVAMTRARRTLHVFGHSPKDVNEFKPRGETFYSFLRRQLEPDIVSAPYGPQVEENVGTVLSRLAPNYQFDPPTLAEAFEVDSPVFSQSQDRGLAQDPVGPVIELELSGLVRDELHRQAWLHEPSPPTEHQFAAWNNRLTTRGVTAPDRNRIIQQAREQCELVLQDDEASWFLGNSHSESETGVAFTAPSESEGGFLNYVVDRTFIDTDGTRWLIKYTTSFIGQESEEELMDRVSREHAQVLSSTCQKLAESEQRKVHWGIYVTSLPKLIRDPSSVESDPEEAPAF